MAWNEAENRPPTILQALRDLAAALRKQADELDHQAEEKIRRMAAMVSKKKGGRDGLG